MKKLCQKRTSINSRPARQNVDFSVDENGCLVGVKSADDLLKFPGTAGFWNVMVFSIGCYCTFTHPMYVLSYQFVGAVPDHWCRIDTLIFANWSQQQILDLAIPIKSDSQSHEECLMYDYNYTLAVNLGYEGSMANRHLISTGRSYPIPCHTRDFNYTQYKSTLVTEWDLVCERLHLYSTTQSVSQLGFLIGAVIFGYLLDLFGRRRVVLTCVVASLLCAGSLAFVPDFELYILLKTLTCTFLVGYYVGCFVILMELCPPTKRCSVGSMFVLPFALGYMVTPGLAYFVRSWRWLQAVYSIPLFLLLSYFWLLPESPTWLINEGRHEEALKIFTWAARVNRRSLPSTNTLIRTMKHISRATKNPARDEPGTGESEEAVTKVTSSGLLWQKFCHLFAMLSNAKLRLRTLICFFCWFSVSMLYYGTSLSAMNIGADPYLYVFLGGVVEIPSYLILWPAMAYLGRKVSLVSLCLACAVPVSILAIVLATSQQASVGGLIFLSLMGKLAVTAAFHLIYVFTAELFPSDYRSLVVGEASVCARIGSMVAPYINDVMGMTFSWGPSTVFALTSVMAAGLAMFLPETKDAESSEAEIDFEDDQKKENGSLTNDNT